MLLDPSRVYSSTPNQRNGTLDQWRKRQIKGTNEEQEIRRPTKLKVGISNYQPS
jgi:hypothetical protein